MKWAEHVTPYEGERHKKIFMGKSGFWKETQVWRPHGKADVDVRARGRRVCKGNGMWGLGLDWYGVEEEQFWGSCGHGHKHSVSTKWGEFLE